MAEESPPAMESMTPSAQSLFAPTRWSLVQRAKGDDGESRKALAELSEACWPPVFRYLRGRGWTEDLLRLDSRRDAETRGKAWMGRCVVQQS